MISLKKSRIDRMFRNYNIQNKIVAIFLAIIALLALAGSAVVFVYLNTLYKEQTLASANMELGKVNDMIAKEIENVYHASYVILQYIYVSWSRPRIACNTGIYLKITGTRNHR